LVFLSRALVVAALSGAFVGTASVAFAQTHEPTAEEKETARTLMKDARQKRASGNLISALASFQAADAIMHVPTTGYEVARAQADLGQLVQARDTILRVLRIPEQAGDTIPFQEARENARGLDADLEARIPYLTIHVTGVPAGATPAVTVDGVAVPAVALVAAQRVNPGHHVVVAKANGGSGKGEVDLKEQDKKEVSVVITGASATPVTTPGETPDASGAASTSPDTTTPPKRNRTLTWIAFGVAGVGAVAGTVTGILTLSAKSSAQSGCTPDNRCPPSTYSDIDAANRWATISTVSFIVAGVGAVVGIGTLVFGGKSTTTTTTAGARHLTATPYVGLGSAGLLGEF
jgi:hypothetical protein